MMVSQLTALHVDPSALDCLCNNKIQSLSFPLFGGSTPENSLRYFSSILSGTLTRKTIKVFNGVLLEDILFKIAFRQAKL